MEIRLQSDLTIEQLKQKIYQMTTTLPEQQSLFLIKQGSEERIVLSPDACTLADFYVENDDTIYVLDRNAQQNAFTLLMEESKHYKQRTLTFEEYKKINNSVYTEIQNRLQNDPKFKQHYDECMNKREQINKQEQQMAQNMKIGERCEFDNKFRGQLLDICEQSNLGEGLYCKIKFDEPIGDLENNFVKYVKIQHVKCGPEYVEKDILDDSSESSL